MKKNKFIIVLLAILLIVLVPSAISLLTDYWWFSSEGYAGIFTTVLSAKLLIGAGAFVLTFLILSINILISRKRNEGAVYNVIHEKLSKLRLHKALQLSIAAIISIFTALAISSSWETILLFLNNTSFGIEEALFGRDISFYFFILPAIKLVIGWLFWVLVVSFLMSAFQYIISGFISVVSRKLDFAKKAKRHLLLLASLFFIVLSIQLYIVGTSSLLYSNTGPFTGASYTDINAKLPVLWILSSISMLVALGLIINIFQKRKKLLAMLAGLFLVVAIGGYVIYPIIIQKLVVLPNELSKESEYIKQNIEATQHAYNLDRIEKRDLTGETKLTTDDIENNQTTIKNIRLWDRRPLLDTFGQIQEIRTYYDFISIDDDRYYINDEYRQTMISPRELNSASLPAATFVNQRLVFTHGYGLAMGPVNEVTDEGLPLLFIKDIPPASSIDDIQVKKPEIYFGELSSDYVFVNTKENEFDYPSGDENVFANYEGAGGVALDSFGKKLIYAAKYGSSKILFSSNINTDSKILYHRNITDRAKKVLPFLTFDGDPYIVIDDQGNLQWIYDAYTTSNAYPYAELINEIVSSKSSNDLYLYNKINYIRNSVKVVINAYDGNIKIYNSDPDDPIIQAYKKIFPDVFLPLEEMEKSIKAHIRYPEDIFKYQTALYTTYHMEEPQIFYNKEDQWEIPKTSEEAADPMMRHLIMKLPDEEKEEFILMLPYTPSSKDNLSAWIVARSDGDNYGSLVVYRFPKQKLVYGPKQIINRINQDAEISRQISLWDQRGSEVNLGNLLVIPIEESLIYVRPLYLRAEGGLIPELKRVIVAYENKIIMSETLSGALSQLFSESGETALEQPPEQSSEEATTDQSLINQAQQYYQNALEAQKNGDWSTYGEEIEKLGNTLNQLNK